MKKRRLRVPKEGFTIIAVIFTFLVTINVVIFTQSNFTLLNFCSLAASVLALLFFLYFFRNPTRIADIDDENLVISPADGHVVVVEPTEEWEYFEGKRMIQVSIFMNVFSVHANWYPISGTVKLSKHHKGRHVAAFLPKSSHENERSTVVIEHKSGAQMLMRQVAGALARRVVTYAATGHKCSINEHMGFIKFGSRVDMFFPEGTEIFVVPGERTIGNETIIARL